MKTDIKCYRCDFVRSNRLLNKFYKTEKKKKFKFSTGKSLLIYKIEKMCMTEKCLELMHELYVRDSGVLC